MHHEQSTTPTRGQNWITKLAYFGQSWGAAMGGIVPAIERRIKLCILAGGGLYFERPLPEVDIINFVSRVKQPVLMLNGRYDFYFRVPSSQEPFYRFLGSMKGIRQTNALCCSGTFSDALEL
jgi:hypothetical protein